MKEKLYIVLRNLFIFTAVTATLSGVDVRQGIFGYVLLGGLYGLGMLMVPSILKFMKLPVNFAAQILVGTLLSIVLFFAYRYIVLGFIDFAPMTIGGKFAGLIDFPKLQLDKLGTVIYTAVLTALLSVSMEELSPRRKSRD